MPRTIKLKGTYLTGAKAIVTNQSAAVDSKVQSVTTTSLSVVIAAAELPLANTIPAGGLPLKLKVNTTAGDSNEVTFTLTK